MVTEKTVKNFSVLLYFAAPYAKNCENCLPVEELS